MQNPALLLHVPHASAHIPLREGYRVPDPVLLAEQNLLTDWFTEELFDFPATKVVAPFSRVFCDVERFAADADETMAQYGMGMCYTLLDSGEPLRDVSPALRAKIHHNYYIPHHQKLTAATHQILEAHGQAIIVDCHSFSDIPFQRDLNQERPRPDFCLGTDNFHTPEPLVEKMLALLHAHGYTAKINNPYSGTLVPMAHYQKDPRVKSIMIEVNRNLYMELQGSKVIKSNNYPATREVVVDLLQLIAAQEY